MNKKDIIELAQQIKEVQIGESFNADFEENLWAFQFDKDFKVKAGRYAIVPIDLFNEIIMTIQSLTQEPSAEQSITQSDLKNQSQLVKERLLYHFGKVGGGWDIEGMNAPFMKEFLICVDKLVKISSNYNQEPSALSAEEVWNKYKSDVESGYGTYDLMTKDNFLKAMQELANASMMEHAIRFAYYCAHNVLDKEKTFGELYTEYLNTLTTK